MRLCKFTFTILYHFYFVCILFGMPFLHPFTFLMFIKSHKLLSVCDAGSILCWGWLGLSLQNHYSIGTVAAVASFAKVIQRYILLKIAHTTAASFCKIYAMLCVAQHCLYTSNLHLHLWGHAAMVKLNTPWLLGVHQLALTQALHFVHIPFRMFDHI